MIPDDNPDAGRYVTLKEIREVLGPYMTADHLDDALDLLKTSGEVAVDGAGGFLLRFSKVGEGLYDIMIREVY